MRRKLLVSFIAIIVTFAGLLPLYYVYSYGRNDALQQTVQQGRGSQPNGTYNAPFSYGRDYLQSLIFGIIGIVVVFAVVYLMMLVLRRRKRENRE